jgi:hypothetical protein
MKSDKDRIYLLSETIWNGTPDNVKERYQNEYYCCGYKAFEP